MMVTRVRAPQHGSKKKKVKANETTDDFTEEKSLRKVKSGKSLFAHSEVAS